MLSTFGIEMLVIASRGSQLALWQARWVEARLTAAGHSCRIEIIKTTGDRITDVPLAEAGNKGLFTKEIEEPLLDGSADLAVHSLKDLPTELPAARSPRYPRRRPRRTRCARRAWRRLPGSHRRLCHRRRRLYQSTRDRRIPGWFENHPRRGSRAHWRCRGDWPTPGLGTTPPG